MTDTRAYLDLDDFSALLGVRKRELQRALRADRFAEPAGTDAGQPYWARNTVLTWWAAQGPDQAAAVPVELWPAGTVLTRTVLEAARDGRPYQRPDRPTP